MQGKFNMIIDIDVSPSRNCDTVFVCCGKYEVNLLYLSQFTKIGISANIYDLVVSVASLFVSKLVVFEFVVFHIQISSVWKTQWFTLLFYLAFECATCLGCSFLYVSCYR